MCQLVLCARSCLLGEVQSAGSPCLQLCLQGTAAGSCDDVQRREGIANCRIGRNQRGNQKKTKNRIKVRQICRIITQTTKKTNQKNYEW